MTRAEILAQLANIFRVIFDDESLAIDEDTTAEDIDEWDSLSHINLIAAIEDELKIEFDMVDIAATRNVGDFVSLIEKKS